MTTLERSLDFFGVSLLATYLILREDMPKQRQLAWVGSELERLAGEAYRLADESGDDPESNPNLDPCREPIPGFDEPIDLAKFPITFPERKNDP